MGEMQEDFSCAAAQLRPGSQRPADKKETWRRDRKQARRMRDGEMHARKEYNIKRTDAVLRAGEGVCEGREGARRAGTGPEKSGGHGLGCGDPDGDDRQTAGGHHASTGHESSSGRVS
jgi:hypothetical protein